MPDLAALAAHARAMLPAGVTLGVTDPTAPYGHDWPEEAILAVPSRQAEFAAGRRAARVAMAALGYPAGAIPMGPDRAPVWPMGLTGSIAHSGNACLAIVAETRDWSGLGLDLEPAVPLDPDLWEVILRPEERARLSAATDSTVTFAAKEAVYKAQYPITKRLFGFEAISVQICDQKFIATFAIAQGPFQTGATINGTWRICEGHVVAAVCLPR